METVPIETNPGGGTARPTLRRLLGVAVPAAAAGVISTYLLVMSLSAGGRPVGCGAGSGCDEVLGSRWSRVLGAPVTLPAVLLYGVVLAAAVVRHRSPHSLRRLWSSRLLWGAAGSILAAAGWFIGLQGMELGVFCGWCLTDHGLGILTAVAILGTETAQRSFRPAWFLSGVILTGLLAVLQVFGPAVEPRTAPLAARQIEILEGRLLLRVGEAPLLGAPDAPQQVVVLFDYCCPHCRQTHAQLLEVLGRAPERLAMVLLPTPLNRECNPAVEETEPRFADACALARLALAVWRTDRGRFAEFDRWLFESEQPRTKQAAQEEAARLIGAASLEKSLADPWVEEQLRTNVEAYAASGIEQIPVLLAPGRAGVSGRAADTAALVQVLEAELGLALQ
jgi:uncharacterized membrane protein/protein-disulfide isomerase